MAKQLWATVAGTLYEAARRPLWWQAANLTFTSTGYGDRIPTEYMVKYKCRWRRIYVYQHSNIGSLFIGKSISTGLSVTYIGSEAP